jgi:hypothetical protein
MANSLDAVIPDLYKSLKITQRERVGMISAVNRDSNIEQGAKGETINVPVVAPKSTSEIAAAATSPVGADTDISNRVVTISKAKKSDFVFSGEEELGIRNSGMFENITQQNFAECIRALTNEIETDLLSLHTQASRAVGVAGTTPFGTANLLTDFSNSNAILDDLGAPDMDRQMVLGSTAMSNLSGIQSTLFRMNEAGTDDLLRRGIVGEVEGFDIHKTKRLGAFTKGGGSSYTTSATGFAIGTTEIPIITGTGTVLAGDVITFAGDPTQYVVKTGVAAPGTIELQSPGLEFALDASAIAITIVANHIPNLVFNRSAIVLGTRAPALPSGGDIAVDRTMIQDPVTGLAFEVSMYAQYRQVTIEVAMAWGFGVANPEYFIKLLG